ncbi:MAG: hypothetical protein IPG75_20615 [Gemmatimonadetes bacterium]|nr:hypothetical protein [Gemmatimonadota bacterium]
MSTFLKTLRGGASAEELAQLAQLVSRLDTQRASLEQLVQHADRSIGQLQRLSTLGERVSTIERQLAGVEELAGRFGAAERQLATLVGTRNQLESDLADIGRGIERTRGEAALVQEQVARTMALKDDLAGFLALEGPFRQLRGEMDTLSSQGEAFRGELARLREQHEKTLGQYKAASGRIESFDGDWQRIARTLGETEHRIAGMEQLLADLGPMAESVAQTRRQLAGVRATADQGQKVRRCSTSSGTRSTAPPPKLEHLTSPMQRADQGLERQADITRTLGDLRAELDQLAEHHSGMHDRTLQVAERLDRIESGQSGADRSLALLRGRGARAARRTDPAREPRDGRGVAAGGRPAPQPQ